MSFNKKHIDPNDVKGKLNYNLFYKESFVLFSVMVAGKSSTMMMNKTNNLIDDIIKDSEKPKSLFDFIINNYSDNDFESLMLLLKKNKTGKYSLLLKFFTDIKNTKINVSKCSLQDLEQIKGIGKKSSRFFMLYNREDIQDIAVLDTHILKFLSSNGVKDVPKQTPSGKQYNRLEQEFIALSRKIEPKMSIYDLDFQLWYNAKEYNKVPKIINQKLVFN